MAINLDLAIMALEGLTRNPVSIDVRDEEIVVESEPGEEVTLEPGLHTGGESPRLRVRRVDDPTDGIN